MRRSLSGLFATLWVLLSAGFAQAAPPTCRLVLAPATATIAPSQAQVLEVRVENAQDLYAYQCYIDYDPAVLNVLDADANKPGIQVYLGAFLQADFVQENSVDVTHGRIAVVVAQLNPTPAVSGSGVLFSIDFVGAASGSSAVRADRAQTIIANRDAEAFAVTYGDAEIVVTGVHRVHLPLVSR